MLKKEHWCSVSLLWKLYSQGLQEKSPEESTGPKAGQRLIPCFKVVCYWSCCRFMVIRQSLIKPDKAKQCIRNSDNRHLKHCNPNNVKYLTESSSGGNCNWHFSHFTYFKFHGCWWPSIFLQIKKKANMVHQSIICCWLSCAGSQWGL